MNLLRYGLGLAQNLFRPIRTYTGPLHLQIEVSTYCNLACVMCPHPTMISDPKHMTIDQFKHVFDRLTPLKVALSGVGEPFLNPDMNAMVSYASQGGASTITTSNLTVISPDLARGIVGSGLSLLKGSIDSTNRETYRAIRQKDMHLRVLDGLKNIRDAKATLGASTPVVRLQFVMQKSNYQEIPQILNLCREYGVDAINFQPLELATEEYVDDALINELVGDMDREAFRRTLEDAAKLAAEGHIVTNLASLSRDFDAVWDKYQLKKCPDPAGAICMMPWTSTYVTVDGDIRPCCSFPLSENATLGNIFRDEFHGVWNGPGYQGLRSSFCKGRRPYRICRNCVAPTLARLFKSRGFFKYMIR